MKFILININSQTLQTTSAGGVGAVYTMTNGATMNQVIIYRLNINGQLTWVYKYRLELLGSI